MGLQTKASDIKYLNIKGGKFFVGSDKDTPYDELSGTITNMRYKDEEYLGEKKRKLIITLTDNEDTYQLGINVETASYSALISFLRNIDINDVLTLHPKEEKVEGKEYPKRTILISQHNKFAKSYFTKENSHGLPEWSVVVVGKKKVVDKTSYLDFLEEFVNKELIGNLSANNSKSVVVAKKEAVPKQQTESLKKAAKSAPTEDEEATQESEKLPWD